MDKQNMKNIDIFKIYSQFNQSETTYVSAIHTHTPRERRSWYQDLPRNTDIPGKIIQKMGNKVRPQTATRF